MNEVDQFSRIRDLNLNARTINALENFGLTTIGELLHYSPTELKRVPNFGQTSLKDLQDELATHPVRLADRRPWERMRLRPEAVPISTEYLIWNLRCEVEQLKLKLARAETLIQRFEESKRFWSGAA